MESELETAKSFVIVEDAVAVANRNAKLHDSQVEEKFRDGGRHVTGKGLRGLRELRG